MGDGQRPPAAHVTILLLAHSLSWSRVKPEVDLQRGAVIDPIVLPSLFGLFVLSVILEAVKDDRERHHHRRY